MLRRTFMTGATAAVLTPTLATAYPSVPYVPGEWRSLIKETDRLVLNFRASWSLTCDIKHELITSLLAQNPAYTQITFVDADWDTFGRSVRVQQSLKVQRRSTLIAFQRGTEVARIVNEPFEHPMRQFLDTALG